MSVVAFFLAYACSKTVMLNTSKEPWEKYDYEILEQVKHRCVQHYPDAPCVKLFKKYNRKQYTVICGAQKK